MKITSERPSAAALPVYVSTLPSSNFAAMAQWLMHDVNCPLLFSIITSLDPPVRRRVNSSFEPPLYGKANECELFDARTANCVSTPRISSIRCAYHHAPTWIFCAALISVASGIGIRFASARAARSAAVVAGGIADNASSLFDSCFADLSSFLPTSRIATMTTIKSRARVPNALNKLRNVPHVVSKRYRR